MIIELREQQEASDMRTLEVQQKLALAKDRIYDLQVCNMASALRDYLFVCSAHLPHTDLPASVHIHVSL